MDNKIYLAKNLAPWMMDELLAFSEITKFTVIFLREQKEFYYDDIEKLKARKIDVLVSPFKYNYLPKKLWFIFCFLSKNFLKFFGGYNTAISLKSIGWFFRLDLDKFDKVTSIHAQFATQASILSLMLREYYENKLEYSFTFHAHDIYFNNKWFTKLVNNSINAFSISNYNINYVISKYANLKKEKILLSRLGVFKPKNIKPKEFMKNTQFKIGLISWFVEKKGIKYLLEAMKQLNGKNIQLILAGDGPLKEEILDFLTSNNLNNIQYIGKVKGKAKSDFFKNLDAFILPAITVRNDMDGIPVVLMEAISYGLPLITTDVSGIPEICTNEFNGFLIEEKKTNQIVEAILKLSEDLKKYSKFSENSLKKSSEYDISSNSFKKLKKLKWI